MKLKILIGKTKERIHCYINFNRYIYNNANGRQHSSEYL